MTLSLINSNKDFDFVGWVIKTRCLFYFRSVKFHFVKETHMMLVAFWRWWKLLQHFSTKDNEKNLCQDLLTIENTDSDLKVHVLHYANEPLKNFCKLAKQIETIRSYQKQILFMIKHCLGNSQISSIPELRVFFHNLSLQNKSLSVLLARADIIHPQREIEVLFSTLKNSPFPLAQSIKLHIRVLVLIPCHRCEKSARESRNSHHLITQRDNIHVRAPDMCVDPRGYMVSWWRNLF